jgi:hypothetical protein
MSSSVVLHRIDYFTSQYSPPHFISIPKIPPEPGRLQIQFRTEYYNGFIVLLFHYDSQFHTYEWFRVISNESAWSRLPGVLLL